jgi:hypothetical protein
MAAKARITATYPHPGWILPPSAGHGDPSGPKVRGQQPKNNRKRAPIAIQLASAYRPIA